MVSIRDRLRSGIYGVAVETPEEARSRREAEIRRLRKEQDSLTSPAGFNLGRSERLTEVSESLRRAQQSLPARRRRLSVFGFLTPIPATSIRIPQ